MVQEALSEEAIVGKPAVERGPRIPNLSLVSATRLLDFVTLLLWMFPDVEMLLSKLLEHDTADTQCSVQGPLLASTVPCMRNGIHVHSPVEQPDLLAGMVTNTLHTCIRNVGNQRVSDLSNEHHRLWTVVQTSPQL